MDKNDEIKRANRRALPKFILMVLIGSIIGGLVGFFSAKYGLNVLSDNIKSACAFFGAHIAPVLLAAMAVLLPAVCIPIYLSARRLIAGWDGEDEERSDAFDARLSVVLWISDATVILSYLLIAAAYSGGFAAFDDDMGVIAMIVSIVGFLAILVEAIVIQQKCVDAAKQTNPEKTASVYDTKFQKKWFDSCDEAEKLLVGRCAFRAFRATNTVCTVLAVVLAIGALIFEIGFLPSFAVCLIWIVNQSVYYRESMKYSGVGNSLS